MSENEEVKTDEVVNEEVKETTSESEVKNTSADTEAKPKEEKKPRKKREPKKDKRDEEIAELKDRVTRNLAEFDNFRKRTEKEKAQMFDLGSKSMVEKILPVIDNFERGIATLSDEEKTNPFADGMIKTYKQMITALNEAGVEAIEAVGVEFNPDLHNAVMHVEDENFGENTVCEEFQKGYTYKGSVVRHSMVKVAN